MKKKIIALAGTLALSLFTSVALGGEQPIELYEPSVPGGFYPEAGVLKEQNDCPEDTAFFKNQFPGLTNGPGGSFAQLTYPIDGTDVTFQVFWADDNSFRFEVLGGVAHVVGVTSDTNTLLYDYVNFYPAVNNLEMGTVNGPVSSDGNLNKIENAADVNHLDFCLAVADPGDVVPPLVEITSPTVQEVVSGEVTVVTIATDVGGISLVTATVVGTTVSAQCSNTTGTEWNCFLDTTSLSSGIYTILVAATDTSGNTGTSSVEIFLDYTPPVVTIVSPQDTTPPTQVPGEVTVVATVIDADFDVDPTTVTATVYQNDVEIEVLGLDPNNPPANQQYTWLWDTQPVSAGLYDIRVSAADTFGNTTEPPASVTVEVVKSYIQCFGTLGDEDFGNPSDETPITGLAGGCNPTGRVLIQAPPNGTDCFTNPNQPKCYISGTLLKPANPTPRCGIYGFPDDRVQPAGVNGEYIPVDPSPLYVFDPAEAGIHPDQYDGVLGEVKAAYPAGYPLPPDSVLIRNALVLDENTFCASGCCLVAQHTKGALLDGLYQAWDEENGTAFIKVHFTFEQFDEEGKGDLVTFCYDDSSFPYLQNSFNAGYQPLFQTDDDTGFLTVLTQRCNSPARDLTRGNGFDVSNLIVSTAMPVEQDPIAVLNFMFLEAREDFDRIFFLFGIIDRDGLLLSGNFNRDVQNPMKEAQRRFSNFNPLSLQKSIESLQEAALGIRTKTTYLITEANPPGEALALIEHLIYELGVLRDELIRVEGL